MNIATVIRKFIIENFLFEDTGNLKEDTSFLESGVMDSTGVLELVSFIEETFGIVVEDEDLVPENLDSIARIARYIEKKQEN
ncbi:MAG: acyl carrier protein [Deltaproteobacteria bacterium]|nr:acyl carrier protein [Deltaproteobacteria bacterium]